jgi:hypothetical protein
MKSAWNRKRKALRDILIYTKFQIKNKAKLSFEVFVFLNKI